MARPLDPWNRGGDQRALEHTGAADLSRRRPVPDLDFEKSEADFKARHPRALLPSDAGARKAIPMATGLLDYFPDALAAVAEVSKVGNDQHNPGQPLHWAKEKSTDHADCLVRHLVDRGTLDGDGMRHSAKCAWRALALLQTEIEEESR